MSNSSTCGSAQDRLANDRSLHWFNPQPWVKQLSGGQVFLRYSTDVPSHPFRTKGEIR